MKVKELIEILMDCNENSEVEIDFNCRTNIHVVSDYTKDCSKKDMKVVIRAG